MKYVTQLGAYGIAVAAAFAVALAVLVSVSSTPTAEAATVDLPEASGAPATNVAPGDTVTVQVNGKLAQVSITGKADGVGASFVANDGQSIACSDGLTCDKNTAADAITVELKVDADSGEGFILLSVSGAGAGTNTAQVTKVVTVSKAGLAGSLAVKASAKTIAATGGSSTITATVKDASGDPSGLNGQKLTFVTTLGNLTCPGSTDGTDTIAEATNVQVCQMYTTGTVGATPDVAGMAAPTLSGAGREGKATITVTLGSTFTKQIEVTLFGTAKNLTATPDQGSVEIGGSVYVVLTVTDNEGNPISGQMISPVSDKEVVGPADDAVKVVTEKNTAADGDNQLGRGYSKDKPAAGSAAAIPACGDDNTHIGAAGATFEELFGPDPSSPGTGVDVGADNPANVGEGTNAKGQCVVYVTAPEDKSDATKNATRGVHTLNFQISATVKASAVIEVAGKPSSITTDAPERVELASVTEITVSVWDDDDVLVGITSVKVRKVGGDGLIEDQGEGGSEMTSNGQSKFTFIAPSTAGTSEILITAGKVDHRVTLQIGEEVMEEPVEPEVMPEVERELRGAGPLRSFVGGGSVEDLAALVKAECPGGADVYATDAEGAWQFYRTGAPAFANAPFSTAFADGLWDGQPIFLTRCEADAMEDEG